MSERFTGMRVEPVNPMAPEGKAVVMDLLQRNRLKFFDLIGDSKNWHVQTRISGWEVRDLVGHVIDVTESDLSRFESARRGETPGALGAIAMAETLHDHALQYRGMPRQEALERLYADSARLISILEALTSDEWVGLLVTHPFLGPLPAGFYAGLAIMEFGLHSYDVEFALGNKLATLDEATAGVLIPYCFIFRAYTVNGQAARGLSLVYGVEVSEPWGGKWRATVSRGRWEFRPDDGDFKGCDAVFKYAPSEFVLTVLGRFPGGSATGDPDVIETVRRLFSPVEPLVVTEAFYSSIAEGVEPAVRPEWAHVRDLQEALPWLVQLEEIMRPRSEAMRIEVEFEESQATFVAETLASLDRSFRLASRLLEGTDTPRDTPRPISPREGGRTIIDAKAGSLWVILLAYGAAETWAAAHPLAVAGVVATISVAPKFVVKASRRISKMLHPDKPRTPPTSDPDPPFEAVVRVRRLKDGSLEVKASEGSEPTETPVRVRIKIRKGEDQVDVLFGLPGRKRQRPAA